MSLKAQELSVLRFTSDALVSAPSRWAQTLSKVKARYDGQETPTIHEALTAMERAFKNATADAELDRAKIATVASALVGSTTPALTGDLNPSAAAGFALKWSLGEPPSKL